MATSLAPSIANSKANEMKIPAPKKG